MARSLRFAALFLTAVSMAAGLAHLLVLPRTLSLDRASFLTVQQIYRGWSWLGLVILAALGCTGLQTITLRRDARAWQWSLGAAVCIAAALGLFFALVFPVNLRTVNWTRAPANWQALRARWELGHALSAVFYTGAFSALVIALLPRKPPRVRQRLCSQGH